MSGREMEVAVIGAGPAGLATAAMLGRRGVPAVVIDRAAEVGASWRGHYDRLHLHTVRWLSHLPGLRFSRAHGDYVSRDGVVAYLERYARHHALDLRLGTAVERLDPEPDGGGPGWRISVAVGEPLHARRVVVATGYNHTPVLPPWPGREGFAGELVHASRYRNAAPYRGRDVLVVGTGNTGAEIAVDLVEGGAGRVRLAVRTPPNIVLREVNGMPAQLNGVLMRYAPARLADALAGVVRRLVIGDLSAVGLPRPARGPATRAREEDVIPIIDVGLIDCVKRGAVEIVGAVAGFDGREVLLAGGERIAPDAVIAATGYARGLEPLVGHLGVLGAKGRPVVHGPREHPSAPGLHFIGYTNPLSGMFLEIGIDARRIARAISRAARRGPRRPSARARSA